MHLRAEPISAGQFATFGTIVSCDRDDRPASDANLGSAQRRDFLVDVTNLRPQARLNVASFRCRPWSARPLQLRMLEKHPMSTQLFVPMSAGAFLVVVARGDEAPDLATARAFVVEGGGQGVGYAPGVWHHPMIALNADIDFTCLVWEDGTALDCVSHPLAELLTVDGLPAL